MTFIYAIAPIITLFCLGYLLVRLSKVRTREGIWCPVHETWFYGQFARPLHDDWSEAYPAEVTECDYFEDPTKVTCEQKCIHCPSVQA